MIERYYILRGDTTTANGKVITANSFRVFNDIPVAYERDQVHCPKCNSIGFIQPTGPRLSDTWNGKEVALGDDLCVCKCSPSPRLVASQNFACQIIDGDWHAAEAFTAAEAADQLNTASSSTPAMDSVPLLLLDPETNEPFKNRPYRLELTDKVIEGTTDQKGATSPLTASERAKVITWHVYDEK